MCVGLTESNITDGGEGVGAAQSIYWAVFDVSPRTS